MTIPQYIEQVQKLYKTGLSSEHSYRGDLRTLLESIVPGVMVEILMNVTTTFRRKLTTHSGRN